MRADAKLLARAGYTYLGRLYSEMDCQAFVERCLRDCGITINLAGSNTWYRRMTWTGTPEECKKQFGHIPVGAFLFILEQDGKEPVKYWGDGIGNASHIGIYTATGKGAIHSSASRGCVVESRFTGKTINGGWNRVGLWKYVMYDVEFMQETKGGRVEMETVIISGGNENCPINVRRVESTSSELVAQIPQDSEAELVEEHIGWSLIRIGNVSGYVKNEFVHKADDKGDQISVSKADLEKVYDILGDMLGLRG